MNSIVTIVSGPSSTALIDVADLRAELGITGNGQDAALARAIQKATAAVESYLGRKLAQVTVSEEFRRDGMIFPPGPMPPEGLLLDRWPLAADGIESVTVDDTELDADEYQLDGRAGILYRLGSSGERLHWYPCRRIVVEYTGGYELPLSGSAEDQAAIAGAAMELATGYFRTAGRDPSLKAVDIPGVQREEYFVDLGGGGSGTRLPADIAVLLDPYRRIL